MTYDYFESDEFKELLSLYQNAVREGNSYYLDVDDFISLSDYFVDKGEVEQAENVLLQALKIHPESKAVKIALAGVLICNYKFDDAKILINDVSETDCYDVLYLQAQLVCAVDKDYVKCNLLFNRWIEYIDEEFDDEEELKDGEIIDPDEQFNYCSKNRDARFRILMSFAEFMDKKEQETYVRQWLNDYIDRFRNLGRYKEDYSIAEACYDFGQYDLLEDIITQILNLNPYYEHGWTMLGVSQQLKGEYTEAVNSLEFAIAINPENRIANLTYAQCLYANQNYDKALKFLLNSSDFSEDATQNYYIGKCYYHLGDRVKAIEYFNKVLDSYKNKTVNDSNINFYFDLAEAFYLCDRINQAISILRIIINSNPDHTDSNMLMACIYLHNNSLYDAIELFSDLIAKSDFNELIITDVASRLMAYDYNAIAIFLLRTIIKNAQNNGNFKAFALLSISFYKENRIKECLQYLKILCENAPDIAKTYFYNMLPDSVLPSDYFEYLSTLIKNNIIHNN